ncbi:putative integral membrane protein [Botrytis fragariae]|uniref:Putative integral membrane protein n=1 Tax=Botrytis fragariae TaxID=1964551 RepID=A0A8H6B3L3_9HELO|nr:putative integral membrane protein [Botrytis fragariae]KAF5878392.1 putative integral membrane protein [Botrytis fragariae]
MWAASGIILAGTFCSRSDLVLVNLKAPRKSSLDIIRSRILRQEKEFLPGEKAVNVALLYRRLFVVNRQFNIWSAILCVIIILWTISFCFAVLFQCGTHISAFWTNGMLFGQYCDTESCETTIFCITDVLTDFAILLTPIPVVWKPKMSMGARLALCSVFALGIL